MNYKEKKPKEKGSKKSRYVKRSGNKPRGSKGSGKRGRHGNSRNAGRGADRGFKGSPQQRTTVPPSLYQAMQAYSDRGITDASVLIQRMTSEFDAQVANITTNWIEPALLRAVESKQVDKFSATEIADYADYIAYATHFLLEMRSIKFLIDTAKSVTRADTAGNPWTKASYNAYVASALQTEPVHIPVLSQNLAGLMSTPVVFNLAIPSKGYTPMYFYPMIHSSTPANIETLLQTMNTKLPGLIAENQYHKLGRYLAPADLQYRAPVLANSEIGQVFKYYMPGRDDTNAYGEAFDASYVLYSDQRVPLGVGYDYHRVLGYGSTTYNLALTVPTAAKVGLEYAAIDDTAFVEVPDFVADGDTYNAYAGWLHRYNRITASSRTLLNYEPFQQEVAITQGESMHDRIFQQVLVRDLMTERFADGGLITLGLVPLGARVSTAREQGRAAGYDAGYSQGVFRDNSGPDSKYNNNLRG
jgi:hypothetical protein